MRKKKNEYRNPVEVIDRKPPRVELTEPVEPDKFDRHMRKARRDDICSRRQTFISQSRADDNRDNRRQAISPSVY
ncbi:MAG: hypothetical protein IJ551_09555 [Prevotella sp.]|nr:hypothetical protein [Prevotella sp.]